MKSEAVTDAWERLVAFRGELERQISTPKPVAKPAPTARLVVDESRLPPYPQPPPPRPRMPLREVAEPEGIPVRGVNDTERAFLHRLAQKKQGAVWHRSGWPDFLVEHGKDRFAVEVKRRPDKVSPTQARMFAALERAGVKVYIWEPALEALVPWRKWSKP